jgi:4-hydroxy-3-polyprenylbenzoate decarboxylase
MKAVSLRRRRSDAPFRYPYDGSETALSRNNLSQERISPRRRRDLRDWIAGAEEIGELRRVSGAKTELEMGALTEWVCEKIPSRPAILFDAIPGYPSDYRVVVNYLNSLSKVAYTVGLAPDISARDFVALWRCRVGQIPAIPPVVRRDGPVMERVLSGDEINLLDFPGPLWHERDGGRYLGTGHVVISQDPDGGWVNLGAYRAMTHDEKTIGLYLGRKEFDAFVFE